MVAIVVGSLGKRASSGFCHADWESASGSSYMAWPADGRTGAGAIFLPAQVEAFPPVCAGPKKDGAYGSKKKTPRRTWLSCLPASTAGESGSASSFFEEIP